MATITLEIPEHYEQELRARAVAEGKNIERLALELVAKGLSDKPRIVEARDLTPEQRLEYLHAWVKTLPKVDVELDVSRESIYEGRGE